MNLKFILKKIIKFFLIKDLALKFIQKQVGKKFQYIYNMTSFFFYNSNNKIKFDKDLYVIKEDKLFWKFDIPARGLFYLNSIKSRGELLHKQYLIDKINFNDNDVVIDCGANSGDFYINFKNKIKYYGIEPSKKYFKILEENIKNQNLFNVALYNCEHKDMKFYLNDEDADSSLIANNNHKKFSLVSTTTLDNIIDKIKRPIKLIKIEGEGAEIEILQGLIKNITKVEFITIDCGPERGINNEITLTPCINYLLNRDFELVDVSFRRIVALFKKKNF